MQYMDANGVGYKNVEELPTQLTEREIISRLGGGDQTAGSCVSLACAYIGNKSGLNVLDFRGGSSCKAFYLNINNRKIPKLNGVQFVENNEYSAVKGAKDLLAQMEDGKEYMLVTGKHASMVRNGVNGYQFLELQSPYEIGWKDFDIFGSVDKALQKRFGCTKSRTSYGTKFKQNSFMIDAESLYNSDEFRELLGYINTAESAQKKGASGSVK